MGQKAKLTALRLGTTAVLSRWRDAIPLTLQPSISSLPLPMMFKMDATPAKSSVFGPSSAAQRSAAACKELKTAATSLWQVQEPGVFLLFIHGRRVGMLLTRGNGDFLPWQDVDGVIPQEVSPVHDKKVCILCSLQLPAIRSVILRAHNRGCKN